MKCKYCGFEGEMKEVFTLREICIECDRVRNQFAAAAIMGLVSNPKFELEDVLYAPDTAFGLADRMMATRRGKE